MRSTGSLILAIVLLGCGERANRPDGVNDFARYPAIAAAIAEAEEPILHEGLPHPMAELGHFKTERERTDIREWHGYWFYNETLALNDETAVRLTRLITKSGTFEPFVSEKTCRGFHPDYALEYSREGDKYIVFLCFRCREAMFFTPTTQLRCDMTKAALQEFVSILTMRKNRPGESDLILLR